MKRLVVQLTIDEEMGIHLSQAGYAGLGFDLEDTTLPEALDEVVDELIARYNHSAKAI